ncbi:TetR/AcrR family transcriptional regulator [Saccharospirillum salsuginis]|uniref:HTH tetR-type domain-containing protein n=1 Tax=Saccharospirillum salsuginis TaxID=418750 RepID=A0A918KAY7_9GAMM|nr:TetR/AcrR family transcriptional regulator [Saccharospirillum salsuginis]GGX57030.1 hypothetical protein GCM10007392_25660 [Saccharospirillum salsuginis]
MTKRKYQKKQRAEQQEQTRMRIVEATMALHEEVGPARTTISAIAERAGVQRLTVYRHFPDDAELFRSCTTHWLELNPPPQSELWSNEADPLAQTEIALRHFYAYYRDTQNMWVGAVRDVNEVTALQGPMQAFNDYLNDVRDRLRDAFGSQSTEALSHTLTHCLRFQTWHSLSEDGLTDPAMAELATRWVGAVVGP